MGTACLVCKGAGWVKPKHDLRPASIRMTFVPCTECCNGRVDDEHAKIQEEDAEQERQDNGQFGVGS